jgi:hypothetical protein
MTTYAKIRDGVVFQYPYDIYDLRRDNPNTSFPEIMTSEQYAEWEMLAVSVNSEPSYDPIYKEISSTGPFLVDGVWTQGWEILDRDAEDITESVEDKKREVRAQRNRLLQETDFYGFSDMTMTSEMSTYRQALRDVPSQEGFPTAVVWPTKPE